MAVDDEYDPTQDDDVASDHIDDEDAPGPSKRKAATKGAGGKDDVRPGLLCPTVFINCVI
jgi:hypothetical protein